VDLKPRILAQRAPLKSKLSLATSTKIHSARSIKGANPSPRTSRRVEGKDGDAFALASAHRVPSVKSKNGCHHPGLRSSIKPKAGWNKIKPSTLCQVLGTDKFPIFQISNPMDGTKTTCKVTGEPSTRVT